MCNSKTSTAIRCLETSTKCWGTSFICKAVTSRSASLGERYISLKARSN